MISTNSFATLVKANKRRINLPPTNLSLDLVDAAPPAPRNPLVRQNRSLEKAVEQLEAWSAEPGSPITALRRQPAREADFRPIPADVSAPLQSVLAKRGIRQLYFHQLEVWERIGGGENVVIPTPTASGKTLCYNLPVLNALTQDPETCALYLFPTKALSEDQLDELQGLISGMESNIRAFTYDGDTPQDARKSIRQRANIVLTNPDMMHSGVLPHHTKWARFFEHLQYIVVDELHTYRGVFGSHVGNLFRRLKRICDFYGSKPRFICCSATIANPKELAEKLVEQPVSEIESNGAPQGERYFAFYNPPVVNQQLGIRRSYIAETRRLALSFLERGQQTLVFANSRLATEILVRYLKDAVDRGTLVPGSVRGYRGGYLPRERREIERQLREGEITGVVATNALELGIDIGSLDTVVMAGYPGTVASTWQRAGRAGRRQSMSLSLLVASSAPLDQFIVQHPSYFFDASSEHAQINPDNLEILISHVKCAAFELPIQDGETFGPHPTADLCDFLKDAGLLHHAGNSWHWTSESYPADAVSLRTVTSDNFVVVDISGEPNVIGEVDFNSALTTLYEKAIYLHEGRLFHVERFDYEERKAYVKNVECNYYTDAIDYTQVKVIETFETEPLGPAARSYGEVRINRQIVGFKKLKFYTAENVGAGKLAMPEQELHTTAFWLTFPHKFLQSLTEYSSAERQSGLTGLGNILRTVGSLLLMCDPRDLGVAMSSDQDRSGSESDRELYLYDNFSGGIGQSEPLYQMHAQLMQRSRELLAACPCEAGCPSCVGPLGEVGEKAKEVADRFLRDLLADQAVTTKERSNLSPAPSQ